MKNIVLVDYENVRVSNLDPLFSLDTNIYIFSGQNQKTIPFELQQSAQKFGNRIEWIKIAGSGPNALDFHIAYFIGKLIATSEKVYFHIISKDKGFDPLIESIKSDGWPISREATISEIKIVKNLEKIKSNPVELVQEYLRKGSKPKSIKTLTNAIRKLLNLNENDDVNNIIADLEKTKQLSISGSKVTYPASELI